MKIELNPEYQKFSKIRYLFLCRDGDSADRLTSLIVERKTILESVSDSVEFLKKFSSLARIGSGYKKLTDFKLYIIILNIERACIESSKVCLTYENNKFDWPKIIFNLESDL